MVTINLCVDDLWPVSIGTVLSSSNVEKDYVVAETARNRVDGFNPCRHMKTRYRGLAKNRAHMFTLFALGNLFLVRRRLLT